ncbi:MAG: GTP cyclohydrolase I FolE [Calditrichia bacterium]
MDREKCQQGMQLILEALGDDLSREGLEKTPQRFAKMCEEIFSGYHASPPEINLFESPNTDSIIIIKEIPFYSMCEHHFLPFFGEMHLAYIPENQKVTGFSDIVQVVRFFSHRLQIQERLTQQIADYMNDILKAKGLLLISHATQLCMSMRGVKSHNARTEVIVPLGEFQKSQELRTEAINLLKK